LEERNLKFNADLLSQVYDHIQWPGRLERISQQPLIYFDVSHNFAGFKTTCDFIRANYTSDSALLLLGMLADKEYERIVQLVINYFERVVVTEPVNDRKLPAEILSRLFEQKGRRVMLIQDLHQAFDFCLDHMSTREVLFVMGSHFLVGELYKRLNEKSLTYRR
jgi:dihydrofolate synthase/folylpolyglutamate synthase